MKDVLVFDTGNLCFDLILNLQSQVSELFESILFNSVKTF